MTERNSRESKVYMAIDLKSFYASVECRERGLDPLTTNLVVADESRTSKTIGLAVSPSLKSFGVPGRPRLFEVEQKIREVNAARRESAPGRRLTGKSCFYTELMNRPDLAVSYIVAPPRMAFYMEYSTRIYRVYLKYVAPEDIHVYSIDEVFIDATAYLATYGLTAKELAIRMIRDVLQTTGITATAGIGSNLYLCKIAMDIMAKRMPPDRDGVRIAELNERSYREELWDHRPLTDFWRIGPGYARRLEANGMMTMGDVARCSLRDEERLFRLFGVQAEWLIDHAWGYEPCTIADIKAYRPATHSVSSGQVLQHPYPHEKARLIVKEMTDLLVLDLVDRGLVTGRMQIDIGYDTENLSDADRESRYRGDVTTDRYGRRVPKHAHGTKTLEPQTSSTRRIIGAVLDIFDRVCDPRLTIRRVTITACEVVPESERRADPAGEQLSMFTDVEALARKEREEAEALEKERKEQKAILDIRRKFGKNAIVKGMNLEEGATTLERNRQIGGHKA